MHAEWRQFYARDAIYTDKSSSSLLDSRRDIINANLATVWGKLDIVIHRAISAGLVSEEINDESQMQIKKEVKIMSFTPGAIRINIYGSGCRNLYNVSVTRS